MQGPRVYHSHIVCRSRSSGFASVTLSGRMERIGKWDVNWNWIPRYFAQSCGSLLPYCLFASLSARIGTFKVLWWEKINNIVEEFDKIDWSKYKEDIPPFTGTEFFLPPFQPSFLPRKIFNITQIHSRVLRDTEKGKCFPSHPNLGFLMKSSLKKYISLKLLPSRCDIGQKYHFQF